MRLLCSKTPHLQLFIEMLKPFDQTQPVVAHQFVLLLLGESTMSILVFQLLGILAVYPGAIYKGEQLSYYK